MKTDEEAAHAYYIARVQSVMRHLQDYKEKKTRENLVRRRLDRRGLMLRKSRRRDPRALDYGAFWIIDPNANAIIVGGSNGTSLDQIEEWLDL